MTAQPSDRSSFWIAALCLLVVSVSNGMVNSGLAVYDEVLLAHLDTTIAPLKLRDSITFLGSSAFVLLAGLWVDRRGTKRLLMAGLGLLSLVYLIYPLTRSLPEVYGLHLLCALVLACAGNMTAIVTAAHAMPDRTGLAIGMAVAGTSVGGMFMPPLAAYLISSLGWQTAMQLQAAIPLMVLMLVFWLLPARAGRRNKEEGTADVTRPLSGVFRSRAFYTVTLAASLTYYSALSLFSHLFLYLRSLDIETQSAALGMSTLAACALAGKLIVGHLSDRLPFDNFFRAQMALMLVGVTGIAMGGGWLWLAIGIAGFGWGGLHALYNIVLVRLFGLAVAGRVNSTVSVAEAIGGATGIAVTGWLADASGYPVALAVAAACCATALLLVFATPTQDRDSFHTKNVK